MRTRSLAVSALVLVLAMACGSTDIDSDIEEFGEVFRLDQADLECMQGLRSDGSFAGLRDSVPDCVEPGSIRDGAARAYLLLSPLERGQLVASYGVDSETIVGCLVSGVESLADDEVMQLVADSRSSRDLGGRIGSAAIVDCLP